MKIYTRTGDDGTTSLFSGGRVRKDHLRVEAYGTVDELNSVLGVVRTLQPQGELAAWLEQIQNELFHLGSDLATPLESKASWVVRVEESSVQWLETTIDAMTAQLPELKTFILPGGTPIAAHLHVARTVCRRAERLTVGLAEHEDLGPWTLQYLNRLSDWLFTAARYANLQANVAESAWSIR